MWKVRTLSEERVGGVMMEHDRIVLCRGAVVAAALAVALGLEGVGALPSPSPSSQSSSSWVKQNLV